MGGNRVGGAVRERETLRVGEAIGRNRVRQIGEGRGKMPLVASHSDAYMQAKHAHAHADLQSRLHFIVSLLAKEITSGALNQINKVRGVSELSLLHLRILTALQWWAGRKPTLNQRDIERAGHSRDYIFFPTVDSSRFIENRFAGLLHLGRFAIFLQNIVLASCCPRFPPLSTEQGFFTGLYVGEQEEVKRFPAEVFWVMDVDTFLLDTRRTGSSLSNASRRYRHGHFAGLHLLVSTFLLTSSSACTFLWGSSQSSELQDNVQMECD